MHNLAADVVILAHSFEELLTFIVVRGQKRRRAECDSEGQLGVDLPNGFSAVIELMTQSSPWCMSL